MKTFKEFDNIKYHGSGAARGKWKTKQKKIAWMKQMSAKVGKLGGHEGKIDWDTATHLFNQGKNVDDVAKIIVKHQTEDLNEIKSILNYKGDGKKFSSVMLAKLKAEYAKIEKIDPSGPGYKKMKAVMAKMSQEQLQQIVDAKIKFLQYTAADLLKK